MKISASIYAKPKIDLALLDMLEDYKVDFIHIDCNDDMSVFDDIRWIKSKSKLPIDLHIISNKVSKFYDVLAELDIDYVTFQYENLEEELVIDSKIKSKIGIAITTNTDIKVFDKFKYLASFILIMASTPGKSGGSFDVINFAKIKEFSRLYPDKKIHVDGGVNNEISFVLRNLGVYAIVSGSYLLNADDVFRNLSKLKFDICPEFSIDSFMTEVKYLPILHKKDMNLKTILEIIEKYQMGFCIIVSDRNFFEGVITSGDIRRFLLKNIDTVNKEITECILNNDAVVAKDTWNVREFLEHIRSTEKNLNFVPVLDSANTLVGAVSFEKLVKGEL